MNQMLLLYICTPFIENKACNDLGAEGFNSQPECLFCSTFGVFAKCLRNFGIISTTRVSSWHNLDTVNLNS